MSDRDRLSELSELLAERDAKDPRLDSDDKDKVLWDALKTKSTLLQSMSNATTFHRLNLPSLLHHCPPLVQQQLKQVGREGMAQNYSKECECYIIT